MYRSLAFFYSTAKAFEMLPFTTQKYQKQFLNFTTEEMCLKNSMQLHPNLISKLFLNDINYNGKTISLKAEKHQQNITV